MDGPIIHRNLSARVIRPNLHFDHHHAGYVFLGKLLNESV